MDSQSLLCQWLTLRGGDDGIGHHVQTSRDIQHRYCTVHQLVIPAVGDQAVLEPVCRYPQDQEKLDSRDAIIDRGRVGCEDVSLYQEALCRDRETYRPIGV